MHSICIGWCLCVLVFFLCLTSYVLTELIQYIPFAFSEWNQTFLTCVLVLWLLLDNVTFAIDLRVAMRAQQRLIDAAAMLEHRVLESSSVRSVSLNNQGYEDRSIVSRETSIEQYVRRKTLTLELLHWKLLASKACAMYYVRCLGISSQSCRSRPVGSAYKTAHRSRSLSR
jgi:hypothetical protein